MLNLSRRKELAQVHESRTALASPGQLPRTGILELKGKMRSGELKFGKTFKDAAEKFLPEYQVITYRRKEPKICREL